jgi:hypothetical protein
MSFFRISKSKLFMSKPLPSIRPADLNTYFTTCNKNYKKMKFPLRFSHGLMRVQTWTAVTLGSRVRISLGVWIYARVFVLCCTIYAGALRRVDPLCSES